MFIVTIPYILHQPPPKPPIVEYCKHQVEIDTTHWECMSESEYQQYIAPEELQREQNDIWIQAIWDKFWWGIISLIIIFAFSIYMFLKSDY